MARILRRITRRSKVEYVMASLSNAIQSVLTRNVGDIIDRKSLEQKLKRGKKLRIKLGCDPTAPDLHLGHAVLLRKLREFQKLGHTIVFIIGDFTAAIGDPSGRSVVRPLLTEAQIRANAKTYFKQAGKILDVKAIEVRRNSEWLSKLSLAGWMKVLKLFTVSRLLERDDFQNRLKSGEEVWMHEVMYPLLQAYDSVAVKADVELGGPDQLFNLMAGRHLQEKLGGAGQDVMVTEYIVGLDGTKKMSKSLGNYIGIAESPQEMFGKAMSIPDELIIPYFKLTTDREASDINVLERRLRAGDNPRDIKLELAKDLVSMYHSGNAAERARAEFIRVFSKKELPREIDTHVIEPGSYEAAALIMDLKLAKSRSEAWRLVEQGAMEVIPMHGEARRVQNPRELVSISSGTVVRVGKTRFVKVR